MYMVVPFTSVALFLWKSKHSQQRRLDYLEDSGGFFVSDVIQVCLSDCRLEDPTSCSRAGGKRFYLVFTDRGAAGRVGCVVKVVWDCDDLKPAASSRV